jgi:inositol hexakisphosphate/diphosphoinositol-pentakisphosphate kinase
MSLREPLKLIVRKDLLDDSNAAKDLMDDVKKRLKILLRPGEPEKRPELIWPKSMNKEPVEVLKVSLYAPKERRDDIEHTQEAIELLSGFRAIMGRNFDTLDVEKIQERW